MTQTVSVPGTEHNLGRTVADFMYVEATGKPKLNKRSYQNKMNIAFKQTEAELNKDLTKFFQDSELVLKHFKVYHSSHLLSKDLRIANFRSFANGLTFIVFEFENNAPLFYFTICSKDDNFSRLEGRVYAKRKALRALTTEGIAGLFSYPTDPQYTSSINPLKIGNWIVKHHILPEKEKKIVPVNALKYQDEEKLLGMAKEVLGTKYKLDPSTFKLTSQYIRFYRNKTFAHGLVCTPEWFKTLDQEGKELISNGGYTVYSMVGVEKETGKRFAVVTFAICSKDEAFTKSYGRKQCLINFIKDKVEVFSMEKEVLSMKNALISLAETSLQHAINVKIDPKEAPPLVS